MTAVSGTLSSRPAAEAYLARVCFKVGPPTLIGAELEWFTRTPSGARPTLDSLAEALGAHTPQSLRPESPALALRSGSVVSVEPGGQIELSSSPATSLASVVEALRDDEQTLTRLLDSHGISSPEAARTRCDLPTACSRCRATARWSSASSSTARTASS